MEKDEAGGTALRLLRVERRRRRNNNNNNNNAHAFDDDGLSF